MEKNKSAWLFHSWNQETCHNVSRWGYFTLLQHSVKGIHEGIDKYSQYNTCSNKENENYAMFWRKYPNEWKQSLCSAWWGPAELRNGHCTVSLSFRKLLSFGLFSPRPIFFQALELFFVAMSNAWGDSSASKAVVLWTVSTVFASWCSALLLTALSVDIPY